VILTFHFTVLSRVFFRAESFRSPSGCGGILAFMHSAARSSPGSASCCGRLRLSLHAAALGHDYAWQVRAPGWALGLVFAAVCLGIMLLLGGGPRAFIYFQF
jgi:hypothetical protein